MKELVVTIMTTRDSFNELLSVLSSNRAEAPPAPPEDNMGESAINIEASANPTAKAVYLHVAPLCAPGQKYLVDTVDEPGTAQRCRKSFYAPHCKKQARECGGWHKGSCNEYNNGRITVPNDFLEEKEERKRVEKRQHEMERKAKRKKAKQSEKIRKYYIEIH